MKHCCVYIESMGTFMIWGSKRKPIISCNCHISQTSPCLFRCLQQCYMVICCMLIIKCDNWIGQQGIIAIVQCHHVCQLGLLYCCKLPANSWTFWYFTRLVTFFLEISKLISVGNNRALNQKVDDADRAFMHQQLGTLGRFTGNDFRLRTNQQFKLK